MDLWIRSQYKETLKKVHYLKISKTYEGTTLEGEEEYSYSIVDIKDREFSKELAKYKTEERALEVLDEIQQRIIDLQVNEPLDCIYSFGSAYSLDCVYQMPEK